MGWRPVRGVTTGICKSDGACTNPYVYDSKVRCQAHLAHLLINICWPLPTVGLLISIQQPLVAHQQLLPLISH